MIKYFLKQGANQIARDWGDKIELLEPRFFEKGDLLVVRLPGFALGPEEVDHVVGKMRSHKGVVLDLRGNPGGFVDTVDRLLSGVFQHEVKIADRVMRKETKPLSVAGRGHDGFVGRFAVLIDSRIRFRIRTICTRCSVGKARVCDRRPKRRNGHGS